MLGQTLANLEELFELEDVDLSEPPPLKVFFGLSMDQSKSQIPIAIRAVARALLCAWHILASVTLLRQLWPMLLVALPIETGHFHVSELAARRGDQLTATNQSMQSGDQCLVGQAPRSYTRSRSKGTEIHRHCLCIARSRARCRVWLPWVANRCLPELARTALVGVALRRQNPRELQPPSFYPASGVTGHVGRNLVEQLHVKWDPLYEQQHLATPTCWTHKRAEKPHL